MTPSTLSEPITADGTGWQAEIRLDRIYLAVDADEDHLSDAIDSLLAPTQQRFWAVRWLGVNDEDWDVYVLQRTRPELAVY